jgi:glutathione S-transferase
MILYTINGSGSDAVAALSRYLDIDLEIKPRSENRTELEKVNSTATVPTVVMGDLVITETVAILRKLAATYDASLLGKTDADRVLVDELLSIVSTGLYAGYIQRFRPEKFVSDENQFNDVKALAAKNLAASLDHFEKRVPSQGPFLVGDYLTIADFYATVVFRWQQGIQPLNKETPKLATYWEFIQTQDSVKAA